MTYYNENDPKAAAWLRALMDAGCIPKGDVDERSIESVRPGDLVPYGQCHFFAGIGGWAYALRLAGWPEDRPVWTGSVPCQPFSTAGKGLGASDRRHLWPEFIRLIRQRRPVVVFGEQVAGAVRHGWLDGVCADLEGAGYAFGAAVLGAHSVGAPHVRRRLYWVGDSAGVGRRGGEADGCGQPPEMPWARHEVLVFRGGEKRRIAPEPAFFPLADGVPARVVRLRGYGNAVVPQVAAEFVKAWEES